MSTTSLAYQLRDKTCKLYQELEEGRELPKAMITDFLGMANSEQLQDYFQKFTEAAMGYTLKIDAEPLWLTHVEKTINARRNVEARLEIKDFGSDELKWELEYLANALGIMDSIQESLEIAHREERK